MQSQNVEQNLNILTLLCHLLLSCRELSISSLAERDLMCTSGTARWSSSLHAWPDAVSAEAADASGTLGARRNILRRPRNGWNRRFFGSADDPASPSFHYTLTTHRPSTSARRRLCAVISPQSACDSHKKPDCIFCTPPTVKESVEIKNVFWSYKKSTTWLDCMKCEVFLKAHTLIINLSLFY